MISVGVIDIYQVVDNVVTAKRFFDAELQVFYPVKAQEVDD